VVDDEAGIGEVGFATHAGDAEYNLVTRSSDGQLMFLVNKLAKMESDTPLGSRIAEVHNGSSLFTKSRKSSPYSSPTSSSSGQISPSSGPSIPGSIRTNRARSPGKPTG
jgi:hypothetical protein